ncbi:MAG: basic amino acid/polyamine antiporter, family [Thermoproteota archaeon]|nr:basic amino acid/polyamine antiporter, family [Thermoproteota archaeon]
MRNVNPVNPVIATSEIVLRLVLIGELVQIAALTNLTILIYHDVTNMSALKLHNEKRLFPKIVPLSGLISCLGLAAFLPQEQWLWTFLLLAPGIVYILIRKI